MRSTCVENEPNLRSRAAGAWQSKMLVHSRSVLGLGVLVAAFAALGCSTAQTREERGAELYNYCSQCHGDVGQGIAEYRAPSIGGLPEWYVQAQVDKFRIGARGDHPEDLDGLRMRPMARTLATQAEVELVSEHVAALPIVEQPATVDGDAERGRALYETCVQCHQADGSGDRAQNAPPLTHQADWYLVAQLEKFKDGIRGTDPLDTTGAQMRPMALSLTDEQAVRDVVAYIRTLED